eukprot:Lankesteria_metandrocarpae@DN5887_c0_g1_i1.p1
MPSFGFQHYAALSTVTCIAVIVHACLQQEGLFDILVYLTSVKTSIAILNNFAFMCFISVGVVFTKVFIGRLRDLEVEELLEAGRRFLMDTILFLVLSTPTIQGREVTTVKLLKFIAIVVALKIFHLMSQIRVTHLFEI